MLVTLFTSHVFMFELNLPRTYSPSNVEFNRVTLLMISHSEMFLPWHVDLWLFLSQSSTAAWGGCTQEAAPGWQVWQVGLAQWMGAYCPWLCVSLEQTQRAHVPTTTADTPLALAVNRTAMVAALAAHTHIPQGTLPQSAARRARSVAWRHGRGLQRTWVSSPPQHRHRHQLLLHAPAMAMAWHLKINTLIISHQHALTEHHDTTSARARALSPRRHAACGSTLRGRGCVEQTEPRRSIPRGRAAPSVFFCARQAKTQGRGGHP